MTPTHNGRSSLDGMLGDEDASLLRTAIEALGVAGVDDLRSPGQRRADGLVELARRALQSSTTPSSHGVRPHLMVTVSQGTLRRQPGAAAASLRWGGVVPGETARRLACDASVVEVVVGEEGDPLSVGRARRTIPPTIRRALEIRDGGCRWPGCGRPAEWTDVHHVRHWVDGGETTVGNLVLLCRRHHRVLHEGGRSWEAVLASVPGGLRAGVAEADGGGPPVTLVDRGDADPARSP